MYSDNKLLLRIIASILLGIVAIAIAVFAYVPLTVIAWRWWFGA